MNAISGRASLPSHEVASDSATVDALCALIRNTDSFTQTVAMWVQGPVEYVLRAQHRVPVPDEGASALDVPRGTPVVRRSGVLRSESAVFACVRAVVVEHRLNEWAREQLAIGEAPLGAVLSRHGVRRHTHSIRRTSEVDEQGQKALEVTASLTVAGVLVARVNETVYQVLLDHRDGSPSRPGTVLHDLREGI